MLSCATDHRLAHVAAVRYLTNKGYDLTNIDLFTEIKTVDDRGEIPGRKCGYYDPETFEIIILKNAPDYCLCHEVSHMILHRLGIDIGFHHSIIND